MSTPLVSVVVPNYNHARYLDERLQSLLAQTLEDFEIVFVDDASTDNSREVLERYGDPRIRATWCDTQSGHAYRRWNDGAALARGRYLCFAGSDDACEPEFLETLARALEQSPASGLAYCRSRLVDPDGVATGVSPSHARWDEDFVSAARDELPFLLDQRTIPTASAVLIRREVFERCGGFDISFRLAADHMLWARVLHDDSFSYVSRVLNRFRSHDGTVRARTRRSVTVEERYRVYGYILKSFSIDGDAQERLRERLARNWIECWTADAEPQRLARHRAVYRAARAADPAIASRIGRQWTERTLGIRVPGPRRVLRYAWRRAMDERYLLGGRRILWSYSAHYRKARRAYRRARPDAPAPMLSPRDLGVLVIRPEDPSPLFPLPGAHPPLVERVAAAVDRAFAAQENYHLVRERAAEPRNADVIAMQLRDPMALDGLRELSEPLVDQVERAIYGAFTIVDRVYVYRSPVSHASPRASWLWHFDNHPREMLKVMVYLSDVDEDSAPFEYLRHRDSGRPVYGAPLAPMHHHSRIAPGVVDGYLANGHETHRVTGPRGTVIVFDDNVIHRATLARSAARDVVVCQVRPVLFEARPRIDSQWTGSFQHHNVNRSPYDLAPLLKAKQA